MLTITTYTGNVGEEHFFRWRNAVRELIAAADVSTVTCALKDADGTCAASDGEMVSAGSVPSGYSFGWTFGAADLATARTLIGQFTVTKSGGGAVALVEFRLIVKEALADGVPT